MILVDTSVWVGHLRANDTDLACLLDADAVCTHPYVIGEIGLGHLRQRKIVMTLLLALPQTIVAKIDEVRAFVENRALFGRGIGYVDACLLAAACLTPNTSLWTRDRKLEAVAVDLGLSSAPPFPTRALG